MKKQKKENKEYVLIDKDVVVSLIKTLTALKIQVIQSDKMKKEANRKI